MFQDAKTLIFDLWFLFCCRFCWQQGKRQEELRDKKPIEEINQSGKAKSFALQKREQIKLKLCKKEQKPVAMKTTEANIINWLWFNI